MLRRLLARGLVRAGIVTYVFSALALVANLVTGVVTARALGPSGRGVFVALGTVAQLTGFLFAMGVAQSLSYYIARNPQEGPSLLSSWVVMLIPLTAVAIGIGELLLPLIFSDDQSAVDLGRWFLLSIVLVVGLELNYGLLLGKQDFVAYNVLRLAQPALTALAFIALWALDELTVESALIAAIAGSAVAMVAGLARSVSRIGVGPVDAQLGLRSLWYGVRGQGSTVATNVTARLDVAMLPAFVSSASVGLYSVAANISLIVHQLSNTFAALVLPATAAGDADRGHSKVVGSLWASLVVAALLAIVLALFARPLIGLVYGDSFREAAEQLVLLLPGVVLFAGSSILAAGVYAAGRPFTATLAQLLGMAVTVVGLFAFLDSGGINAAALVSTASYATVFAAMLIVYKSVTGTPWAAFVPTRASVRKVLA
jgi:O-antigen/teichoic acid export membrane protein